jgi:hypothetical protein
VCWPIENDLNQYNKSKRIWSRIGFEGVVCFVFQYIAYVKLTVRQEYTTKNKQAKHNTKQNKQKTKNNKKTTKTKTTNKTNRNTAVISRGHIYFTLRIQMLRKCQLQNCKCLMLGKLYIFCKTFDDVTHLCSIKHLFFADIESVVIFTIFIIPFVHWVFPFYFTTIFIFSIRFTDMPITEE